MQVYQDVSIKLCSGENFNKVPYCINSNVFYCHTYKKKPNRIQNYAKIICMKHVGLAQP